MNMTPGLDDKWSHIFLEWAHPSVGYCCYHRNPTKEVTLPLLYNHRTSAATWPPHDRPTTAPRPPHDRPTTTQWPLHDPPTTSPLPPHGCPITAPRPPLNCPTTVLQPPQNNFYTATTFELILVWATAAATETQRRRSPYRFYTTTAPHTVPFTTKLLSSLPHHYQTQEFLLAEEWYSFNLYKSVNLEYNMLVHLFAGTNDSSTKRLMFQVLFYN